MPNIVISYRREDTKWIVGRIFDRLEQHYGHGNIFMDIDRIPLATDYRDHIRNTLQRSDIVLAVIGPQWLAVEKETGQPRIADETDWVRIEIEAALGKKIPVIPVLIDRSRLPKTSELAESVREFAFRQAADIDTGVDFRSHMERLIRSTDQLLDQQSSAAKSNAAAPPAPVVQKAGIISGVFDEMTNIARPAEEPLTQPDDKTPLSPITIGGQQGVVQNFEQSSAPVEVKMPAWTIGALSGLVSPMILILILIPIVSVSPNSDKITVMVELMRPLVLLLLMSCIAAAFVAVFLQRSGGRYAGITFMVGAPLMGSGMFLALFIILGPPPDTTVAASATLAAGCVWSAITGGTYWLLARRFGGPKLRVFN
jgi:hypothetical protein